MQAPADETKKNHIANQDPLRLRRNLPKLQVDTRVHALNHGDPHFFPETPKTIMPHEPEPQPENKNQPLNFHS